MLRILSYGAGLGVRVDVFNLGTRFRYADFSDWQLWTLDAEAGVHVPLGRIEPYFVFGVGYASLAGIHSQISTLDAHGLTLRSSAGVDFHASNWFSVGVNLSGDVLFLVRKGDGMHRYAPADPNLTYKDWVYGLDGSGNGLAGTLSLVLGVHF